MGHWPHLEAWAARLKAMPGFAGSPWRRRWSTLFSVRSAREMGSSAHLHQLASAQMPFIIPGVDRISARQPVWPCYWLAAVSAAGVIVPNRPSFWPLGPAVKNSVSELDLAPPPRVRVHSPSIVSGFPSRPLT
jgi:hypothetical protein